MTIIFSRAKSNVSYYPPKISYYTSVAFITAFSSSQRAFPTPRRRGVVKADALSGRAVRRSCLVRTPTQGFHHCRSWNCSSSQSHSRRWRREKIPPGEMNLVGRKSIESGEVAFGQLAFCPLLVERGQDPRYFVTRPGDAVLVISPAPALFSPVVERHSGRPARSPSY